MAESGSSRTLTDISVEGVQKRKLGTNKPQNVFAIKVTWSDGTVNLIYRSYRNFNQLEERLLQEFDKASCNNKAKKSKVIPKLQGKDRMRSDEHKKWEWIDNFNTELLDLPTAISECDIVEEFFTPTPEDLTSHKRRKEEEKSTKANKKKGKKRRHWKKRSTIRMIGSPISMKAYRVLEDYAQQSDKEISLQGETTVFVISKRDDGWWMVNSGEETGWAPGSYLQIIDPDEDEQDVKEAAIGKGEMYYSLKRYKAKEDDELSFPIGVTLQILRKNLDGWWTAIYLGRKGYVPALYLRKLNEKKKQRRHFSIKQLTIKGSRKPNRKISRTKDTLEDKATENNYFNSAKEQKQRTGKKLSFDDQLGIPSRSKMSVKRKRVHLAGQNQNAQIVPLSPSEEKIDSESSEETQEAKVDEVDSFNKEELAPAHQPLKSPIRKKSNTFSGMRSFVPSIRVTRPTVKKRARSLSLGSAVEPRRISSTIFHEARTASNTYVSQDTDKRHSATDAFDSPLNNGRPNSLQESELTTSFPSVLGLEKERKCSSTGSESSSKNDSPGASSRQRRKGVVTSPITVKDGSLQLLVGPGDTDNTLDMQNPLKASSNLSSEERKPQQITSKVLIRKKSQSLNRLQTPNLSSYSKLSTSMPDIRQAGTDSDRDWHPQEFTELHPKFQRKAIKIVTKKIRSASNASNDRARPRSLVDPKKGGSLGRHEPSTFFDKKNNNTLTGKKKEQHNSTTTLPRTNKDVEGTRNAFHTHAYSDADLQSLYLRNTLTPIARPRSPGSAAGSYPCSCSSGSLSELEFNSDESENQTRWDWERAGGNEEYRNIVHDFDSVQSPPTYSLPECPGPALLPEPAIYRAICEYDAENEQELSFLEGEELEVTRRAENGWWFGRIGKEKGWVPSNYLRAVSSSPVIFVPLQSLRPFGNCAQLPLE